VSAPSDRRRARSPPTVAASATGRVQRRGRRRARTRVRSAAATARRPSPSPSTTRAPRASRRSTSCSVPRRRGRDARCDGRSGSSRR
jgi:hypothetical protein